MELRNGTTLKRGEYTIISTLGHGGFGITYLAKMRTVVEGKLGEMNVDVDVVIKEYYPDNLCDRGIDGATVVVRYPERDLNEYEHYLHKFEQEAYNLSNMRSPYIVDVVDIIKGENNTSYYVMRHLNGGSLQQKAEGGIGEKLATRYINQVAQALEYMHQHNMCHYDVKPNNVMLDSRGNAVLIDFGFSSVYHQDGQEVKSTLTNMSQGYSPLEQGSVKTFSPTVDVYSLGATLYFLLTGRSPQQAAFDLRDVIGNKPDGMSYKMWNVITRCMQPHPNDRLQSMQEVLTLLSATDMQEVPDELYTPTPRTDDSYEITSEPTPTTVITGTRERTGNTTIITDRTERKRRQELREGMEGYKEPSWMQKNGLKLLLALIVIGVIAAAVIILLPKLNGNSKPQAEDKEKEEVIGGDNSDNNETARTKTVENLYFKSGQGVCSYTGEVDDDDKPNGNGKAVFDRGDVYEGTFVHGKMSGTNCTYTFDNGDTYSGSFVDDHFDKGRIVLKKDGYVFEGTFTDKNQPKDGKWYDKDGKEL